MSISQKDIKKLFGLSAGRCNICNILLTEADIQIGEMAHIIAKNAKGPRGSIQNINDNSYNNLILLCPNHHLTVDQNPHNYPSEYLHKIKNEYEKNISLKLDSDKKYLQDISSLNTLFEFIPIKTFRGMALELPNRVSINFNARYMFEQFYINNPDKYPFWDDELTNLFNIFLTKMDKLTDWIEGTISNTSNRLITINEMINRHPNDSIGYNSYVFDDNQNMVINKINLNDIQINKIYDEMPNQIQNFIDAHTNLINYIRYNYQDIRW